MPAKKPEKTDYETLRASSSKRSKNGGVVNNSGDLQTLRPSAAAARLNPKANDFSVSAPATLTNPLRPEIARDNSSQSEPNVNSSVENLTAGNKLADAAKSFSPAEPQIVEAENLEPTYAELQKQKRSEKRAARDAELLSRDRWLARNGHNLTYGGIFLFTLTVYFRPYELIPALSGLTSLALIIAVATLLVYLPTQFSTEGSLTILSTEVKCVLFIAFWALLTMPIAKDAGLAWATFNDTFSKVVIMFVVMVNTLRTRARLKGLMWLSIGVGVMLSYQAIDLYRQGVFKTEGYRVNVDFGGMFGNPNDMALHLVIFAPVAVALGLASKNLLAKLVYFSAAGLMVVGNMVTQSRGGFLGLLAVSAVLVLKLGKRQRLKVILISSFVGALIVAFAPGDYGRRILSIFIPSLDAVGSSDQRRELLQLSLLVTARNPQGIGLGNFPIVGYRNLQTHNAYTQVSSELGWLAFVCYVVFLVSPLKKLAAIERRLFAAKETSTWIYYLAIGLQASIAGYMVSSFFAPVAYNWFVYYPIAYAVCLRRIYRAAQRERGIEIEERESRLSDYFNLQKA